MIITRTPFRMSFFGGGTDYPPWFENEPGAVLATTIDKYCYISARYLPPFFEHKSRIIYSKTEHVHTIDEINHPSVRETLRFLNFHEGVEIHHDGDLPARTGLGSSSSFTVGLLRALYALKGIMPAKERLAKESIHIEQDLIGENVGCQDQTLAAHGGFNYIQFGGERHLHVEKMTLSYERLKNLQDHLMLFFTGFSRNASDIAAHQVKNIVKKKPDLKRMYAMTHEAIDILNNKDLCDFGRLLHESWQIKRTLSDKVSTSMIDDIYNSAMSAGALGGKLLGAGGGGFVLLFVEPDKQENIRRELNTLLEVPFKFEQLGTQVIFYQPDSGVVR